MFSELIEYTRLHNRVCPIPSRWDELWRMLPRASGVGERALGMPLILGAWWNTPPELKQARLREHLEYARLTGVLDKVDTFLRALAEEEWAHVEDF
jgi:hypothetical protein